MKKTTAYLLLILLLKVSTGLCQVSTRSERDALFLYTFAKYINWSVFVDQKALIIGVYDDDEVYLHLRESFYDRKIGERKIRIKKISGIDAADCQILFVSKLNTTQSRVLLDYVRHLQVLVVSDCPANNPEVDISILSNGTRPEDYSLKINKQKIQLKGLKISMELMGLVSESTNQSSKYFAKSDPLEYFRKPETFTL